MSQLVDALERGYRVLGIDDAASGDEVFRHLALVRIIEPSSKLDTLRVLQEAGIPQWRRDRLPLLFSAGELVWVPGLGLDCRYAAQSGEAGVLPHWIAPLRY